MQDSTCTETMLASRTGRSTAFSELLTNLPQNFCVCPGVLALELASDIRKVFDLPTRDLVFGEYNVREVLEKRQPGP
jgi:hypothetical protein